MECRAARGWGYDAKETRGLLFTNQKPRGKPVHFLPPLYLSLIMKSPELDCTSL